MRVNLLLTVCVAAVLGVVLQQHNADAVDRSKFRTCMQTGFCSRHRRDGQRGNPADGIARLVRGSVRVSEDKGVLNALVQEVDSNSAVPALALTIQPIVPGSLRVRLTEVDNEEETGLKPRWEAPDVLVNSSSTLTPLEFAVSKEINKDADDDEETEALILSFPTLEDGLLARIQYSPFRVDIIRDSILVLSLNHRDLLHFEQRRNSKSDDNENEAAQALEARRLQVKEEERAKEQGREILDWGEDGKPIYKDGGSGDHHEEEEEEKKDENTLDIHAPEHFGGHSDTRPHGSTSVGMDVLFAAAAQVYGIPEHATSLALKGTTSTSTDSNNKYNEPYRLYNLDVFEYEMDEPMALYGAIPVMIAHNTRALGGSVGLFWNNPTETFVDVDTKTESSNDGSRGRHAHWMSESGVFDAFLLLGPTPLDVSRQYAALTGTTPLPPMFALAYHQCRWNYRDEKDVSEVNAGFEEHDIPYDVLWLDIEHTDGKRYFTWDKQKFQTPARMQEELFRTGRRMVTIVDPHIKRDNNYYVHKQATSQGLYVKDADGKDFDGWCWPGSSSYLDFTSVTVRDFWADQFAFDKYKGSTPSLFTWNDMNEPSVFNGPEVSMRKDLMSITGVEHREWHNLYGFYQHMATSEGLIRRFDDRSERPFVLSRSFFAGSQRFGAIWTGDNAAEWAHLQAATPMLLSMNIAGLPLIGSDVGGFFGNPDVELWVRWYQSAAFQPFFRAHAHLDSKRREPWVYGTLEAQAIIKDVLRTRYSYLPLWYSLFEEHARVGSPVMRPMYVEFPDDASTFAMDDQWMVGSHLLVKPVVRADTRVVQVYLPVGEPNLRWFNSESYQEVDAVGGAVVELKADLHEITVLQRGGAIVPRKMRARRSSVQMLGDAYTLVVALDKAGQAEGNVYVDDEHSHAYANAGQWARAALRVTADQDGASVLSCDVSVAPSGAGPAFAPVNKLERVVVMGVSGAPTGGVATLVVGGGDDAVSLPVKYDSETGSLVIKVVGLQMFEHESFSIKF